MLKVVYDKPEPKVKQGTMLRRHSFHFQVEPTIDIASYYRPTAMLLPCYYQRGQQLTSVPKCVFYAIFFWKSKKKTTTYNASFIILNT